MFPSPTFCHCSTGSGTTSTTCCSSTLCPISFCRNVVFPTPMFPSTQSVRPLPAFWRAAALREAAFSASLSAAAASPAGLRNSITFLASRARNTPVERFGNEQSASTSSSLSRSTRPSYHACRLGTLAMPLSARNVSVLGPTPSMAVSLSADFFPRALLLVPRRPARATTRVPEPFRAPARLAATPLPLTFRGPAHDAAGDQ
mmetsp:Transcript_21148/g.53214  ORF Transcript_21148/g.53214 Transcript_21148/m.53214 type:complete len:202 (+) Transcript_21148:941-1546(+)